MESSDTDLVLELETKRAEADKRGQQLTNLPIAVMEIDTDYNVVFLNAAGAKTVGVSPKAAIGSKCYQLFKTDHCQTEQCALRRCMRDGATHTAETVAHPHGRQPGIPIRYTGSPVFDTKGTKIVGALEAVIDQSATYEVVAELSAVDRVLQQTVDALGTAAAALDDSSQSTATSAGAIGASATSMAASMDEISGRASEVQHTIDASSAAVEEMSAALMELSQTAARSATLAAKVEDRSTVASESVGDLSSAIETVSRMVDMIADIADQTKLLALNAAIEAANAGNAGTGFAVVAREVKDLARTTADATEEIASTLTAMKASRDGTVQAVDGLAGVVDDLNTVAQTAAAAVEEQSTTMGELSHGVQASASAYHAIVGHVGEAQKMSRDLRTGVHEVGDRTRGLAETSGNLTNLAGQIAHLSAQLGQATSKFKLAPWSLGPTGKDSQVDLQTS